ncbi:MAG: trypsin-like peptidase domain-containing protein [Salinivenus sp.]
MSTQGKFSLAAIVGTAFLAGIFFATAGASLFDFGEAVGTSSEAAALDGSTAIEQEVDAGPRDLETAFTEVADTVNPAVVQIQATKMVEQRRPNPFQGTPFEQFFGNPREQERQPRQGLGSGAIIRSDGYIVTNNHVVENADELRIVLFDGSEYDAEVVGTDSFSDLAVLKIEDPDQEFTAVSFGNSDDLRTGQWVLAVGSPLSRDLKNTVTAGIVSAVGRLQDTPQRRQMRERDEQQLSAVQNFVQTDAAINPGNSGGPLVDLNGRMAGLNTAIASNTGGYQGVGFAIPANTVERVATQIIEEGEVRRAYLGVNFGPASQNIIESEDLPSGAAVVSRVQEDTPADEAGLEGGDIIVAIDGERLSEYLQVSNTIAGKEPGDEVELTINRDGEERTLTVTLGEREEATASSDSGESPSRDQMMEELGIGVRDIDSEIAEELGLDNTEGVVITDVDESNPMIRNSGLSPRQVIIEMAGKRIPDVDTFREVYGEIEPGSAFRVAVRLPEGYVNVTSLRKPTENE